MEPKIRVTDFVTGKKTARRRKALPLAEGIAIRATVNILCVVLSGRPRWAEMHPLNLTQVVLAEGRETGWASCPGLDLPTFRRSR